MPSSLPGKELPTDPGDNPCWVCGPRNPLGLRLRMFDDGKVVRARAELDDRYCGWPGTVLEGVVYAAMDDVLYWTAWARLRELVHTDGKPEVAFPGRVRTNEPFVIEALHVGALADGWHRFEAVVLQRETAQARMAVRARLRTVDELKALLELPDMPRSLQGDLEAALAARGS
ncbi:MAG TPA: hypothetical protein VM889_12255 [Candidatus Thermoplasmatota archaeon]|nr:hypothetical protein [Candidatus Thermoplasmatota archaeon]